MKSRREASLDGWQLLSAADSSTVRVIETLLICCFSDRVGQIETAISDVIRDKCDFGYYYTIKKTTLFPPRVQRQAKRLRCLVKSVACARFSRFSKALLDTVRRIARLYHIALGFLQ